MWFTGRPHPLASPTSDRNTKALVTKQIYSTWSCFSPAGLHVTLRRSPSTSARVFFSQSLAVGETQPDSLLSGSLPSHPLPYPEWAVSSFKLADDPGFMVTLSTWSVSIFLLHWEFWKHTTCIRCLFSSLSTLRECKLHSGGNFVSYLHYWKPSA